MSTQARHTETMTIKELLARVKDGSLKDGLSSRYEDSLIDIGATVLNAFDATMIPDHWADEVAGPFHETETAVFELRASFDCSSPIIRATWVNGALQSKGEIGLEEFLAQPGDEAAKQALLQRIAALASFSEEVFNMECGDGVASI